MYSNPYVDNGGDSLAALWGVFACAGLFTLLFVVLYLWLFYRIFSKAGYSGWYTLLNLIPYVGSVIVVFMLAFGDWPALHRQGPGSYGPAGGYPPTGPGYGGPSQPSGYAPPVGPPPQQQTIAPPPAPVPPAAPVEEPSVSMPPAAPVEQAPAPAPAAPEGEPPAPPA